MLKARKFTAHAQCHVTFKQGVKNDHTFGIAAGKVSNKIDGSTLSSHRASQHPFRPKKAHINHEWGEGDAPTC